MGRSRVDQPPSVFSELLLMIDPAEDGREIRIARDLVARHGDMGPGRLSEVKTYVDALLADDSVTASDLKGLLNRSAGPAWGIQFDFGADAKAARRYLEALSHGIAQELL
ncbi:MAG: hypothetical protein B7Z38_02940 [Rhodobacterales bacterium 12-64-8]|nr:MAG: hypothetical protein B7Z38_02940 [Rhodobacterales bacterium 12-64-8]OYX49190.1 MAG: hypothetical protein B7Y90_08270 [Alphaproteobacteria bacterium 32-64-14]